MKKQAILTLAIILTVVLQTFSQSINEILNNDTLTEREAFYIIESSSTLKSYTHTDSASLKRYNRVYNYVSTKLDSNGTINEFIKQVQNNIYGIGSFGNYTSGSSIDNNKWEQLGPFEKNMDMRNSVGKIDCIVKDPTPGSTTYYIGTAGAGIWKTDLLDGANTQWECLNRDISNISVQSILINPTNPNIIYISTGIHIWSSYKVGDYGIGILKTIDGGQTWTNILPFAPEERIVCHDMKMLTGNPNIIYALSQDSIYILDDTNGQGNNWTEIELPDPNNNAYYITLAIKENQPNIIYASGDNIISKSIDAGATWTDITYNFDTLINPYSSCSPRFSCAYNSSDNKIYVFIHKNGTNNATTFKPCLVSFNGSSWEFKRYVGINSQAYSFASYLLRPLTIKNGVIYLMEGNYPSIYVSDDNGNNFFQYNVSLTHADVRDVLSIGTNNLLIANDGGVVEIDLTNSQTGNYYYISSFTSHNGNLSLRQSPNIGITEADENYILSGAIDNYVFLTTNGGNNWNYKWGGDGGNSEICNNNPNIYYAIQNQSLTANGNIPGAITASHYSAPIKCNPKFNNITYSSGGTLNDPSKQGFVKSDISVNSDWSNTFVNPAITGTVKDIAISESNPNIVYFSSKNSSSSSSGGWHDISKYNDNTSSIEWTYTIPWSWAETSDIEVNPLNENEIWVTINGFNSYKVLHITINGTTENMESLDYNLPNVPVNCIEYNQINKRLYLGTDFGLFFLDEGDTEWVYDNTLDRMAITDIKINKVVNKIYFSTYGRGMWYGYLPCPTQNTTNIEITSDTTWDTDQWLNQSVVVKAGNTLQINDCRIAFTENNTITVEKGAKLLVYNSKLTTVCNQQLWGGIIVQGHPSYSQSQLTHQGYLQVWNNSTIENARTAVTVNSGGIIKSYNSSYLNNICDIDIEQYLSPSHGVPNINVFIENTFETNKVLNHVHTAPVPTAHVKLDWVVGIGFYGNTFVNQRTDNMGQGEEVELTPNRKGVGILAVNATFNVEPYTTNVVVTTSSKQYGQATPNVTTKNTFTNLYYGIKASASYSGHNAYVKQSDFNNNFRGILLENMNNNTIFLNNFDANYTGVLNNHLYPNYPPAYSKYTYSIYLNECTGYRVEENSIENGDEGIYIYNSGDQSNEIFKNNIHNVQNHSYSSALKALGSNYYNNGTAEFGLNFTCNNYNHNNYNMSVIGNSTIKKNQGSPSLPTGNISDHYCSQTESDFLISASSPINYSYYYQFGQNNQILDCFSGTKINQLTTPNENYCQSQLTATPSITVLSAEVQAKQSEIENAQSNLNNLIDGGNTTDLLNQVENLTHQNYWQICNNLFNASPYLSDTVLTVFMDNNLYRPVPKTLVLMANSPLPVNLRSKINNLNVSYWFKYILNSMQYGTNPREEKEMEISNLASEKQFILNKLIASGLYTDTNGTKLDSIIDFLMLETDYKVKYNLIPLLLKKEDYTEANNQINVLENEILDLPINKQLALQDYIDYLRITKDYKQSNFSTDILSNNLDFLENLAKKYNTPGSVGAQILLESISNPDGVVYNYPEKIDEPTEELNKSMQITNDNNIFKDYKPELEEDLIMVYPNPVKDKLIVEYAIADGFSNGKIQVFNLEGKLMLTIPINKQFDVKTIDVSSFPNGNYLIKIGGYTKQITINH